MQIGEFTRSSQGFEGRLQWLGLDELLAIVHAEPSDAENAPNYRVRLSELDGPEIGAGWTRTGERAGEYIRILFDCPTFAQPIVANLFRDDDTGSAWSLHWSRPQKREERD